MKRIFTLIASVLLGTASFSQQMGIVGVFNDWGNLGEVFMTDNGGGSYSANAVAIGASGGLKFRLDSAWDTNWGGIGFPSGTAELGGFGNDIPATAGTYDVTFNTNTLEYVFSPVASTFATVKLVLGSQMVDLITLDGVNYANTGIENIGSNNATFSVTDNGVTTVYGNNVYPAGIATANGAGASVPSGYITAGFNLTTKGYLFSSPNVAIIGSSVPPYDWTIDVDMTSTDNGVTFSLSNYALLAGELKFRANDSWGLNWGQGIDDGIANDTAFVGGGNIVVPADGNYNIKFNRYTSIFCISTSPCNIVEGFPVGASVSEINAAINFVAVPNPVSDNLTFVHDGVMKSVVIYDMFGKMVLGSNSNTLYVANLESGIYMFEAITTEGKASGRFIKN